ncbi:hypothetical protein K1719_024352 [Acacia pycnantha]|nr:hypothetical protein K1719_024352 [Acacia pycnantha]
MLVLNFEIPSSVHVFYLFQFKSLASSFLQVHPQGLQTTFCSSDSWPSLRWIYSHLFIGGCYSTRIKSENPSRKSNIVVLSSFLRSQA